jgi:hypothetical protein
VIRFFASSTPYHLSVSHKPATISPTPCSFYRQNAVLHSINPQVKKESHHVRSPSTSAAGLVLRHLSISHLRHVEVHGPDRRVHGVRTGTLDVGIPGAL